MNNFNIDNLLCKKKYKKSYDILNELLPSEIVQKYPIKSLMRCFTKLNINNIMTMNIDDIISIYKIWRLKEAKRRRELRSIKNKNILVPITNTSSNKIATIDDNFINKYLSIDENSLINYYKNINKNTNINNKFEIIDKNIDINKIFN